MTIMKRTGLTEHDNYHIMEITSRHLVTGNESRYSQTGRADKSVKDSFMFNERIIYVQGDGVY